MGCESEGNTATKRPKGYRDLTAHAQCSKGFRRNFLSAHATLGSTTGKQRRSRFGSRAGARIWVERAHDRPVSEKHRAGRPTRPDDRDHLPAWHQAWHLPSLHLQRSAHARLYGRRASRWRGGGLMPVTNECWRVVHTSHDHRGRVKRERRRMPSVLRK